MPDRHALAEVFAWWAAAFSVWMISLSTAPLQEYLLAAACGLPCGLAAFGARRAVRDHWTLRPGWLKPVLLVPVVLVTDAVQVLLAVVRPGQPGGRFVTVPTGAGGDGAEPTSRRALDIAIVSVTPGTYVLDADPDSGDLLVHSLAGKGPRLERHLA